MLLRVQILVFCAICASDIGASKILVVFPTPAHSHYTIGNKLMHLLAERGHEVTIIASYRDKNLPKTCRELFLDHIAKTAEGLTEEFFDNFMYRFPFVLRYFAHGGQLLNHATFMHPNVQKLLKDPDEKFDVVIVEEFMTHALKYLAYHFNAPLITVITGVIPQSTNDFVGNPAPVSYVPDHVTSYNATMNFWQRLHNGLVVWTTILHERWFVYPMMDEVIQSYFPGAPKVKEVVRNASLVLLNTHVSTSQPVPLLPNMIEIGGFHVDPPQELPEDLQKYLDGSTSGAVYFSMGTILSSKYFPVEIIDALLRAFSKLNMNILCKWENDTIPGQPPNVKLSKWVPQQDVLAHPNVKLFITHGGLLSTIETIYYGVPMIGIPVFVDQHLNVANAVANGFAIQLDFLTLTEEKLDEALEEILNTPSYAENARKRSRMMQDQIVSPRETAGYWVEYVVRHGGRHFRSPALDLELHQLYSLDVVVGVLLLIVAVYYILRKIFLSVCRM